jgi:hypothetical protein
VTVIQHSSVRVNFIMLMKLLRYSILTESGIPMKLVRLIKICLKKPLVKSV